jgi:signal peptidase I
MATRPTRSAIGCGVGERPADGRLLLRLAGGVGKVKGMLDLGGPRAGTGARTAPVPVAPMEKRQSRLGRWFDNWLRSVGMAVILFVIIKTFLVEAFQIPSGSMERTLLAGDFLFVNKAVYGAQIPGTKARLPGFELPRRGDVIVFAYPKNPELNYVKRVIGLPGDTVEMRGGEVRVNGDPLAERYVQRVDPGHDVYDPEFNWQRDYLLGGASVARNYHPTRDTWGPLVVPAGRYFVLGDNRDNSADSRYWGFVGAAAIKGRPLVVYFSYDREAHDALPWLTDIRWHRLGSIIR